MEKMDRRTATMALFAVLLNLADNADASRLNVRGDELTILLGGDVGPVRIHITDGVETLQFTATELMDGLRRFHF